MKKHLLSLLFVLTPVCTFAQNRLAVKLSPGLCYGRVHTDPDTAYYGSKGVAFRGKIGVTNDWTFKENYNVSPGVFFVAKEFAVQNTSLGLEEYHEIQYIQVPITLKLYTSEIDLDLQCYGELGLSLACNINDYITKLAAGTQSVAPHLRTWEIGALVGGGIEYHIGLSTSLFTGITYQPALSSIILDEKPSSGQPRLFGYTDMFTLDLGVRF